MNAQFYPAKPRILAIDDTGANLALLSEILGDRYRVIVAKSGEKGLAIAHKTPQPELILLDMVMPDMDGLEVCRRLKADPVLKEIPVIFISSNTDSLRIVDAFTQGGVDYISKPFQQSEVLARIETHLQIVTLRRELREHNQHLEELVASRTRELAASNRRVEDMSRLKDEFLRMISHEMRTPANGLFGVGQIILDMVNDQELSEMFAQSSQRLEQLMDDAMLLGVLEKYPMEQPDQIPVASLLQELAQKFSAEVPLHLVTRVDRDLCCRALRTFCEIAVIFCRQDPAISVFLGEADCKLVASLDSLELTGEDADRFFDLGSSVRPRSKAQRLALSPVVAHKILRTFGGDLKLSKDTVNSREGYLEAVLPTESIARKNLSPA